MRRAQQLTILYCGANPVDKSCNHIDLGREYQAISDAVEGSSFELQSDYATSPSRLERLLEKYKPVIVHFGLHGIRAGATSNAGALRDFGAPEGPQDGLVLIENDGKPRLLNAQKLQEMLLQHCRRQTRCVVMSACHSLQVAEKLCESFDHVVGMDGAITDAGAIAFSGTFYRSLARNHTFRDAMASARRALSNHDEALPKLLHREGVRDDDRPRPAPWWVRLLGELEGMQAAALAILLGIVSVVILGWGYGPGVNWTQEGLMAWRAVVAPLKPSPQLRVALIDAQSQRMLKTERVAGDLVGDFGPSWRGLHARVLDRLSEAGARVVAFDVAFQEEPSNPAAIAGTAALAESILRAAKRGTHVVLTAMEHGPTGAPLIAGSLRDALAATRRDDRCAVAHPCIGEPERGAAVPLLPLVLVHPVSGSSSNDHAVSFSLSLCAMALAHETLPSWSPQAGLVFLATPQATSVASTGLEREPSVAKCRMAREGQEAVQRVLAPFATDLVRTNGRVMPFETILGGSKLDVAGKIVLIGQRDLDDHDIAFAEAAPEGKPLWGVSAHAAAIDALLQGDDGLITVIAPLWQILWVAALCILTLGLRTRLAEAEPWSRRMSVCLLATANAGVCVCVAAFGGLVTDPGNHLLCMMIVYGIAAAVESQRRKRFA
jgi:CHASE2 domain-containing sensor protein